MIHPKDATKISTGTHSDPFSVLGIHQIDNKITLRVFHPEAEAVDVLDAKTGRKVLALDPVPDALGVFAGIAARRKKPFAYRLRFSKGPHVWESDDPYRFGPVLGALDEHLISEGAHLDLWKVLGAHVMTHEGVAGTHFAVWAPNARRVSVIGDFNGWDGRRNPMRQRGHTGVWEIFMPGLGDGEAYKYELLDGNGNLLPQKADPFGFGAEHPPKTASVVRKLDGHDWTDAGWIAKRDALQRIDQPISIYEVHLGSWRRVPEDGNRPLSYQEHATELVNYAKDMGFTHIELMPISEYPFDGSWGYQPIGLYAPTIRHGTLEEFRAFVQACHAADLGLILDWVPGHFPEDIHGLGNFDGTALFEYADRKEGFHPDWNTLIYNYGRREVSNFLVANALYWLREHHVDALRVDAVASMLYRDYSRKDGEWIPNVHGGRENLEAIAFLQRTNTIAYGQVPGIMTIAEESTAFPGVSAPVDQSGLGFGFKWNMGWMNDTLSYMQEDPINRKYHHHKMTFGLHYAFTENFVLPISHDEVVHGKGSMIDKMPGAGDDKFANLRAYYGYMWGHPGKKLLFMGCEFAQGVEWNHNSSLDWHLLDHPQHRGVQSLIRDLNALLRSTPALHQLDSKPDGFEWIEEGAAEESIYAWVRKGEDGTKPVLVVSNFTPIERSARRIGVPYSGRWVEKLNTDAAAYAGGNRGNMGFADSEQIAASGRPDSILLTIPPLSTLFFELDEPH
ncbi:1,4-alpha-glucan branching protein GlgB [Yoonia sediminilitoris]|uniref:1,4-alpha-glucan branching enzyme GlgB n=1 Tax=Yoonia sediminilitoris TaxID=1286148 RepID=A0A2T6KQY6_9RHOB|nr:1,4-alpha-glucan branching protein GlgB [Yoonia sediminilitoris]PUB18973.1 1,4-alpha-glucan branching enzyme [Yoonia sediminilitoris]RCW99141.1 1,4-alpha-glucan branching enzyme [Yoonia sediminilitoris]